MADGSKLIKMRLKNRTPEFYKIPALGYNICVEITETFFLFVGNCHNQIVSIIINTAPFAHPSTKMLGGLNNRADGAFFIGQHKRKNQILKLVAGRTRTTARSGQPAVSYSWRTDLQEAAMAWLSWAMV